MVRQVGFAGGGAKQPRTKRSIWDAHLLDNEEIVWDGRPGFGLHFNQSSLKTMAIVAIGLAILGPQIMAADKMENGIGDVPYLGQIDVRIFLVSAAVWTVIWFFGQTVSTPFFKRYMLSDQRAFIAKTFVVTRIKSYPLTPLTAIQYDGRDNGSIVFASESRRADNGK